MGGLCCGSSVNLQEIRGKEVQLVGLYHTFTGYRLDLLGLEWMRWSLNEVRQDLSAMILVESASIRLSFIGQSQFGSLMAHHGNC